jgi:hypothetical protein
MGQEGLQSYLGNATNTLYLGNNPIVLNPFSDAAPIPPTTSTTSTTTAAPSYVTSGLIIYMDSTEAASYPGSGTAIYNLVPGQPYTGSLENGVTYSGGYLNTAKASSQYIQINAPNYTSQNNTVMGATRYTSGTSNGRMIAGNVNNWLLGHWQNSTINYYAEGTIFGIAGGPNDENWRIYAGTGNIGTDVWGLYTNGSLTAENTNGVQGPNGLRVGSQSGGGEYSDGQFAFIMLYNRVLTAAEILQNYNALKSKVGLT